MLVVNILTLTGAALSSELKNAKSKNNPKIVLLSLNRTVIILNTQSLILQLI